VSRPFLIGLTGSIGMGKSTTAQMFASTGIPIWDADAAVHRLYAKNGAAVGPIGAICPQAIVDGAVDRGALKNWIASDPTALKQIEGVVHPLVGKDRTEFIQTTKAPVVLLDIPLLFEGGNDKLMDIVVVVSAPADVQRARVLERPGMSDAMLNTILAKQMPDAQKRARADFIVPTQTLEEAQNAVQDVLKLISERLKNA